MKAALLCAVLVATVSGQPFDLVIRGGRIVDPATLKSRTGDVGIRAGKIAAIGPKLAGKETIDAKGLVVAPGFIDLHVHAHTEENQRVQILDGVTSSLELELGVADVDKWYKDREGRMLIHSGVSVGHVPMRMDLMHDPGGLLPADQARDRPATEEEITRLKRGVELGLQRGAVGLGFGIQYTPAASRWEILEMFRVAARFRAPAFIHIRGMGNGSVDGMTGLQEILAASAITGVPIHMVHMTSSGLRQAPQVLQTIREAKARGVDVSTECYPYTAAQTLIGSAIFNEGWQKTLGIDYGQLQWVATGERLNQQSFSRYRKQNGSVIMHMIPEEVATFAVSQPDVIIASDGGLREGKGHPRSSGTFARVLGLYVREKQALPLELAVRKMTLMPAQRLESYVPSMKRKGRMSVGADADLVIFDPQRIRDRATFEQPALPSEGVVHVLVGGTPVVQSGKLREGIYPGKAIRAAMK